MFLAICFHLSMYSFWYSMWVKKFPIPSHSAWFIGLGIPSMGMTADKTGRDKSTGDSKGCIYIYICSQMFGEISWDPHDLPLKTTIFPWFSSVKSPFCLVESCPLESVVTSKKHVRIGSKTLSEIQLKPGNWEKRGFLWDVFRENDGKKWLIYGVSGWNFL